MYRTGNCRTTEEDIDTEVPTAGDLVADLPTAPSPTTPTHPTTGRGGHDPRTRDRVTPSPTSSRSGCSWSSGASTTRTASRSRGSVDPVAVPRRAASGGRSARQAHVHRTDRRTPLPAREGGPGRGQHPTATRHRDGAADQFTCGHRVSFIVVKPIVLGLVLLGWRGLRRPAARLLASRNVTAIPEKWSAGRRCSCPAPLT